MSKGYTRNQERLQILSSFGRELTRRAKSKCEFCETSGVKLVVHEIPPESVEPDIARCMFICENCVDILESLKKANSAQLRFLENSVWSEVPIVKATAIYLLRLIAEKNPWAYGVLESVYIDPDTETLLKTIKLYE